MTHKIADLDVMDAKVQDEIRSALPAGFSILLPRPEIGVSTWRCSPMPNSSSPPWRWMPR